MIEFIQRPTHFDSERKRGNKCFFFKSQTLGKVVSWGKFKSSTEKEKTKTSLISLSTKQGCFSNNKAITNLFNKTLYAHWVASLVADSPKTFSHQGQSWPTTECPRLGKTQLNAYGQ